MGIGYMMSELVPVICERCKGTGYALWWTVDIFGDGPAETACHYEACTACNGYGLAGYQLANIPQMQQRTKEQSDGRA